MTVLLPMGSLVVTKQFFGLCIISSWAEGGGGGQGAGEGDNDDDDDDDDDDVDESLEGCGQKTGNDDDEDESRGGVGQWAREDERRRMTRS